MADGDVKYRFLADTQQAERNFTRLEKKLDDQERKLKQLSRTTRRGSQQSKSDFRQMISHATSLAGALGLVNTASGGAQLAISALRAEFEDLMQRQREAAQQQQTFAQAFDSALLNLGTDATAGDLENLIARISEKTSADRKQVAVSLSSALSARGNLSVEQVEDAVTATLQLTRNVPDAQAPIAGSALDLQKNFKASAQAALGFLLETGQQARVTSPQQIAQNIAPGIVSVASSGGDSPREAAALTAAITQATADATGATGSTAAIKLDRQLEVGLPELRNLTERIKFLQQNPDARTAFLEGGDIAAPGGETRTLKPASFEVKTQAAIESLLRGEKTADLFDNAFRNISDIGDAAATFDKKQRQFAGTSFRENVNLKAAFQSQAEGLAIEDISAAEAAISREGLDKVLSAAGVGLWKRNTAWLEFQRRQWFTNERPVVSALDILGDERDALRRPTTSAAGTGAPGVTLPPSQSALEQAAKLDRIIEAVERQVSATEKQTEVIEKQQPSRTDRRAVNRHAHTE